MEQRKSFGEAIRSYPTVFWVANLIEVLERFAYYGIYFGFGIYMQSLGYSRGDLGIIQSLFLVVSYGVPVFSGAIADKYGFKRVLIVSYLAYLPTILLLILTKSFTGIALTMLGIGFAAGIFKPLISATVRATTDSSNKTLGFGIFYAMVNVGGSFGPIVAGKLRVIDWSYSFYAAAIAIGLMFLITIFFYKEPPREPEGKSVKEKIAEIGSVLSDGKFALFLVLLGVFFWWPFWSFFNLCALYVDSSVDTAQLYLTLQGVFGTGFANFLSQVDESGVRRILGETISHTGYIIMILQIFVSKWVERFAAMPTFLSGLAVCAIGFVVLGYAAVGAASMVFLGIFLFAFGEMIASPRIQEYITWIAPKEKAGLYMGTNFLAVMIGGLLSGIYTGIYGRVDDAGHPEYVWYMLAAHTVLAIVAMTIFRRTLGEFEERSA
jgi:proton-dependent oligopeptide transporter, POT family